ncbi:hypothetical protein ACFL9T_02635 [Thermodesulfobacteriota bacterium]
MESSKFNEKEMALLLTALDNFSKEEEREIKDLSMPGGNKSYIPDCEKRLRIFKSLMKRVKEEKKPIKLSEDEKEILFRTLDYFKRAEEREIKTLSLPGGNKSFIPDCRERLQVFQELLRKLHEAN